MARNGYLHGMSNSPTFVSWHAMKNRCLNPNHDAYPRYGGRGITVCERWLVFTNFLEDMGIRPRGTSINRLDNSKNYEPSNCEWATEEVQQRNIDRSGSGRKKQTHCNQGHEFTPDNERWYLDKRGVQERVCRKCANTRQNARRAEVRA